MKKSLLCAAILAAMTGSAHAATVTLYGVIDTGIGYQKITGEGVSQSKFGMVSGTISGGRWGLRGTEDLGDGLSAIFALEAGFNPLNGKPGQGRRAFGRKALVGLSSPDWGKIELGRQDNITSLYFGDVDPFGWGQSWFGASFSSANSRYDNMVMYQSPSINGFQFGANYSFNVDDNNIGQSGYANAANTRGIGAALKYSNGPLFAALAYEELRMSDKVTDPATPRAWSLGAAYDFEVIKLAAAVGQTRDGWFGGQGINIFTGSGPKNSVDFPDTQSLPGLKVTGYMFGGSMPVGGSGKLMATWQRAVPNAGNATMDMYSLGYNYDISKRTNVYAMTSYAKNFAFEEGQSSTVVVVGLRHRF